MKPNCRRCYYSGLFVRNRQLASCDCENVTEPTFIVYDELFKIERQYVHRKNWEDECDCEHFIPHLSEAEGDYELEATCTFNTSFDCPFCKIIQALQSIGDCKEIDDAVALIVAQGERITELEEQNRWVPVTEKMPENFVSVLGYIPASAPFPPVRECYTVGDCFYFPALQDTQLVSHWKPMPEPPKEDT